jgi:hypothetical protein
MNDIVTLCKIHGGLIQEDCVKGGKNRIGSQRYKCKSCANERHRNWVHNNNGKHNHTLKQYREKVSERMRWYTLKRKFNITKSEYEEIAINQNHLCAICNNRESTNSRARRGDAEFLCIDHCHKTLKIRGLLCRKCNAALGGFKDSIENLESAILYLKKFI